MNMNFNTRGVPRFLNDEENDVNQKSQADWDAAVRSQFESEQNREQQARYDSFVKELNGYEQIEYDANVARERFRNGQGTALLAVMNSIRNRGGTMDPALCQSVSKALGTNITGAFLVDKGKLAGSVVFGTPKKDANGRIVNGVGMIMSPEQRFRIFDRMKAGDLTKPYMMADYAAIKRNTGLTDDQLANAGFHNPVGQYVAGATTNGKATSALFGRTAPRNSRISFFASDGRGGGMRSEYDGFTKERTFENLGTWAEDEKNKEAERLAKVNAARGIGKLDAERLRQKNLNDRQAAELASKEKRQQAYVEERKALREQNGILSKMRMLYGQWKGEPDLKKKDEIMKQIEELEKGVVQVANPDVSEAAADNRPDAVLGRSPVLGQKGVAQAEKEQVAKKTFSNPREGEVDMTDAKKIDIDNAISEGRSIRRVAENDKVHIYVGPKPKATTGKSDPKATTGKPDPKATTGKPDPKATTDKPDKSDETQKVIDDTIGGDQEKEAEFAKWYAEKRKQHGMEDMSETEARRVFDRDWWHKFKKRVSKNLDDMDNYDKIKKMK